MNILTGKITNLEVNGSLSLVSCLVNDLLFKAIVIETPATASYLKKENTIKLLFKETEVIMATGDTSNISLQNKITGTVINIEKGKLLSQIVINSAVGTITSVITSGAVEQLKIEIGKEVTAMIKTNEILLSE
ncbi:molybdopterin-binding protein [Leeuwenhoekiella sp. A16]|uniref:TOBE domain-containing protein n=1 Tax=unclassified Leeuwenhoekiella TaxID=2615029 RepID=UPI003A7F9140